MEGVFTSSGLNLLPVPFSLTSAKSSYAKILESVCPNTEKDQQFKDGVIWADCLSLLAKDDVTLVTDDRAFYLGRQHENGLAKNLQNEAMEYPHKLRIVPTLAALLDTFPKYIPFDEAKLLDAAIVAAEGSVAGLIANGFEMGSTTPRVKRHIFATENPDKLFFDCAIEITCHDASGKNRGDALFAIEADGLYSCKRLEVDEIRMKSAGFKFVDESGEEVKRRDVWLRTSGLGGHREVTHVIREKLDVA